jgi:hypothetical protein
LKNAKLVGVGLAVVLLGTAAVAMQAGGEDHSQDAAWHNRQMLALAQLKASDGWQSLQGGLRWRRIKGDGSGKHPTVRDTVRIHYLALCGEVAQHVLQDAAVEEIFQLVDRIDPAAGLEGLGLAVGAGERDLDVLTRAEASRRR